MRKKGEELTIEEAVGLIRRRDTVAFGFAVGQPVGMLSALAERDDFEQLDIYTGLLTAPYAWLDNPAVRVRSAFYGPIERASESLSCDLQFLAKGFRGLELMAQRMRPRVVLARTTPPDAQGWLNFGIHSGATFRPFREAASAPDRLAIAEVNRHMPHIEGLPDLGRNRIHVSEVDAWVRHDEEMMVLPEDEASREEKAIAHHVAERIDDGAVLQFGIGNVPNEIAKILAAGHRGGFGIHTEMINDGIMHLHNAAKVENRKGLYNGVSVATFALGSEKLYKWIDGNSDVRMLPVGAINDPALTGQLHRFVSVNAALSIDLLGQIAADHVGGRQYSGVGGHHAFVAGAGEAPEGKSFVCMKSTATVHGRTISTIVQRLPSNATVTTPRHLTQWVVTEHGAVDISALGDRDRAQALIDIAAPEFRGDLRKAL